MYLSMTPTTSVAGERNVLSFLRVLTQLSRKISGVSLLLLGLRCRA